MSSKTKFADPLQLLRESILKKEEIKIEKEKETYNLIF